jgi:predicted GNAT family acetyltransferase
MSLGEQEIIVTNNEGKQRYEAWVDGHLAMLTYERQADSVIYLHTGVPSIVAGRGIANLLTRTALDEARAQKRIVVPLCPFVAVYIRRHPEYLALLAESQRAQFQRAKR